MSDLLPAASVDDMVVVNIENVLTFLRDRLPVRDVGSVATFVYNVAKGARVECINDDGDNNTVDDVALVRELDAWLKPDVNAEAARSGCYYATSRLIADFATRRLRVDMSIDDLGINIVLGLFAEHYSRDQYALFVRTLRCVRELEALESLLLHTNIRAFKLPVDIAVDKKLGLLANKHRFSARGRGIGMLDFCKLIAMMRACNLEPEQFVEALAKYHSALVEAFYMFPSITRNSKLIAQCRDLSQTGFRYTFPKAIPTPHYDGDYWFRMPADAVLFAHQQGKFRFDNYVTRDSNNLMATLRDVPGTTMGFVHRRQLFPLVLQMFARDWQHTAEYLRAHGFNCAFREGPIDDDGGNIYFVKQEFPDLYKLIGRSHC